MSGPGLIGFGRDPIGGWRMRKYRGRVWTLRTRGRSAGGPASPAGPQGSGKAQVVIAELAGITGPTLARIEHGEHAPDSLSQIVALANALQIPLSELTRLPVPAPDGYTDPPLRRCACRWTRSKVRAGWSLPVELLRDRAAQIHQQHRACYTVEVGTALPGLRKIDADGAGGAGVTKFSLRNARDRRATRC